MLMPRFNELYLLSFSAMYVLASNDPANLNRQFIMLDYINILYDELKFPISRLTTPINETPESTREWLVNLNSMMIWNKSTFL